MPTLPLQGRVGIEFAARADPISPDHL